MNSNSNLEKIGKLFGFLIMFFMVTIILFFSLSLSNRLPPNWNYIHIFFTILSVILAGILIKLLLK